MTNIRNVRKHTPDCTSETDCYGELQTSGTEGK